MARVPVHGPRHASRGTVETRGSRHQSLGQDRQATRHRLQPRRQSAGQVESRREDGQSHRAPPRAQYHDGTHRQENHAGQESTQVVKPTVAFPAPVIKNVRVWFMTTPPRSRAWPTLHERAWREAPIGRPQLYIRGSPGHSQSKTRWQTNEIIQRPYPTRTTNGSLILNWTRPSRPPDRTRTRTTNAGGPYSSSPSNPKDLVVAGKLGTFSRDDDDVDENEA